MKNSLDKNAKWLLLFGILLTFLFPLLLPLLNKTGIGNFGVVGEPDTSYTQANIIPATTELCTLLTDNISFVIIE
jgi:hypothetical protein